MEQVPEGFEPMVLFSIRLLCALAHFINNSRFRVSCCLSRGAGDLWKRATGGGISVWAEVVEAQTGDRANQVNV